MESGNQFPWEELKADCLRLVCQQVCASAEHGFISWMVKKEEMIGFLSDVNARGLDAALRTVGKSKRVQREPKPSVKRKSVDDEDVDEDVDEQDHNSDSVPNNNTDSPQAYNTRFKGVKRVKLGREIPDGFPYTPQWIRRGSLKKDVYASPQRSTSDGPSARLDGTPTVPRRGRGRPRKYPLADAPGTSNTARLGPPTKQVFDGVLVMKRTGPTAAAIPSLDEVQDPGDADAEGEPDGEVVISAELNGFGDVVGESEPSGSNEGGSSIQGTNQGEMNDFSGMVVENDEGNSSIQGTNQGELNDFNMVGESEP